MGALGADYRIFVVFSTVCGHAKPPKKCQAGDVWAKLKTLTRPDSEVTSFIAQTEHMSSLTVDKGTWTLEDRFAAPWHYVPVEVAPGTAALRVELEYERAGAVLDLGCLGPSGFRGWSGGARESFVVAAEAATPGYLPGEVGPGLWQVIIGLHQVPAEGVRYRVTAETVPGAPPAAGRAAAPRAARRLPDGWLPPASEAPPATAERPARRDLPAAPGRRWLAGDLHSHTVHSDGALTVSELACFAVRRGLDYLAITDHNTVSHHAELPAASARYGITLLPGQEVTTAGGHAGVLGDTGWIDFRRSADDWLDAAEASGGLMSVNHPIGGAVSWMHHMRRRPPLAEVWHWSWLDPAWTTPLAWWQAWDPAAIPVGGSDWHREGSDAPPGTPTTWVEADCDAGTAKSPGRAKPDAILGAVGAGRVAISAGRDGPVLLRHEDCLIAADADGLVLAGPDGPCHRVRGDLARLPGNPGYHRLLTPAGATVALTP
jgi:PHP domain-containing protein